MLDEKSNFNGRLSYIVFCFDNIYCIVIIAGLYNTVCMIVLTLW